MTQLRTFATALVLGGCAQGGGCTPIGDAWFFGSVVLLLTAGVVLTGAIWREARLARREARQDRREERREERK
jgi:hypothetical protein